MKLNQPNSLLIAIQQMSTADESGKAVQTVLPIACGLDVHKSFVVAVVKVTDLEGNVKKNKKSSRLLQKI